MGIGNIFKGLKAASKIKDKPKKTQSATKVNVGKEQTKSTPAGVSKKTTAVKKEEVKTSGKAKKEGKSALEAKAKRTKNAMAAEQTARRKSSETKSAARTKLEQKKGKK